MDYYAYISGEIRHLAFRKGSEHATWQDAIKQQASELDNRTGKILKRNLFVYLSTVLLYPFWLLQCSLYTSSAGRKQTYQPSAVTDINLPADQRAG